MSRTLDPGSAKTSKTPKCGAIAKDIVRKAHSWGWGERGIRRWRQFWHRKLGKARRSIDKNETKEQLEINIPFQTTPEQLDRLDQIFSEMRKNGVSFDIVHQACLIAKTDQGMFDLLELYNNTILPDEQKVILADIQKTIDDHLQTDSI